MRLAGLIFSFIIILQVSVSYAQQPIQLAIVLDDMGYSKNDLHALSLPPAITFSILPYTPYAKKIAQRAKQQQRKYLLHIPMQAKSFNEKLGKGALLLNMHEQEFKAQLKHTLNYLPDATGINNHMGSALTEHVKQMQWTMDVLNNHGLYFLDSRTTSQTVAESTANISGVPALRRHIFLDNIKTAQAMEKQFLAAVEIGKKNKSVVIIAHPYPETMQFLTDKFKQPQKQFELVALQALLSQTERLALAKKHNELHQINNLVITEPVDVQPQNLQ